MQQASKEAGVLVFRVDLEYIQPTIMAVAGLLAGRYSDAGADDTAAAAGRKYMHRSLRKV